MFNRNLFFLLGSFFLISCMANQSLSIEEPKEISYLSSSALTDAERHGWVFVSSPSDNNFISLPSSILALPGYPIAWSPNGKLMAMTKIGADNLYLSICDYETCNDLVKGYYPAWSNDGAKIAYWDGPTGTDLADMSLFIIDIETKETKKIITTGVVKNNIPRLSWSTDDLALVFSINDVTGRPTLSLLSLEDNSIKKLAEGENPAWSPVKPEIAYDFNGTIRIINIETHEDIAITEDNENKWPSWSPDGKKIVFESMRDGNCEIYITDLEDSSLIRLTANETCESKPEWRRIDN